MALSHSLICTTEPTSEPVSLAEVKLHCRIAASDTSQDDALAIMVQAAREVVEGRTGLALMPQEYRLKLPCFADRITIPKPPLTSINAIKYLDPDGTEQTLGTDAYQVLDDCVPGVVALAPGQSWPDLQSDAAMPVTIEFTAGYADADSVPAKAKQAILLLVGSWFENRTAVVPGAMAEVPLAFESLVRQLDIGTSWVY